MQTAPDEAMGKVSFKALAQRGLIIEGFKPTFLSPGFGMVAERLATHGIIPAVA